MFCPSFMRSRHALLNRFYKTIGDVCAHVCNLLFISSPLIRKVASGLLYTIKGSFRLFTTSIKASLSFLDKPACKYPLTERTRKELVKRMLTDALTSSLPFVGMTSMTMEFESIRVSDCEGEVFSKSSCNVNVRGLIERVSC